MSFFIRRMPSAPLMSSPPRVEAHALADQRQPRVLAASPSSARSGAARGAWPRRRGRRRGSPGSRPRAASSPTVCLNFAPCCLASRRTASASSAGPMCSAGVLTRSRVAVTAAATMQAAVRAVARRQLQRRRFALGRLVEVEGVGAEFPRMGRGLGVQRQAVVGQPVVARRQAARQCGQRPGVAQRCARRPTPGPGRPRRRAPARRCRARR